VLGGIWVEVVALLAAFIIAAITTPAGVPGAVLLLPFQVSVLGTPSPSVTPTNLLYNVVASPGAIWRYWRQGQTGGKLTWLPRPPGTLLERPSARIKSHLAQEATRARWEAENEVDPWPHERQVIDWAEHDAHVDGMDFEAER
jgi:hypothetical protein